MAGKKSTEGALWTQWLAVRRRQPRKVVVIDAMSGKTWTAEALTEEPVSLIHGSPRIASIPSGRGATKKDLLGREVEPDTNEALMNRAKRTSCPSAPRSARRGAMRR